MVDRHISANDELLVIDIDHRCRRNNETNMHTKLQIDWCSVVRKRSDAAGYFGKSRWRIRIPAVHSKLRSLGLINISV